MSRLLAFVALVLFVAGVVDHTRPLWAGPTSVAAPPHRGQPAGLRAVPVAAPWRVPSPVPPPAAGGGSVPPSSAFQWPLAGRPVVARAFAPPPQPWLAGHRGVDLAGAPGAPVLAAGSGVVTFAGVVAGVGAVTVEHAGGLRTTYEPVAAAVRAGQPVVRGAVLGTLRPGHPGCPGTACLHWGLRSGDTYLDPRGLLRLVPVRLLPPDGGPDA